MIPKKSQVKTFGEEVEFLEKHLDVTVLSDETGNAQVAVIGAYQGRVMTSTADGEDGTSFGWINHELIASGENQKHINAYGGEERFWMGPEGGQFAIYFPKGAPFEFEYWQTPSVIDTEHFDMLSKTKNSVAFRKYKKLANWSGTEFEIQIDREIRLLNRKTAATKLGVDIPNSVKMVAYESDNKIKNLADSAWKKQTGVLSIWILSMFNPSPATTVVIPFKKGPESKLGPKVNDEYFGKVPPERLIVEDDVLFFSADGKYRSKIGISPKRAKPILASYDELSKTLTLAQYTLPDGITDYVNSMWQLQDQPYAGDAANSYNDGPPEPGAEPMGPFYELESSSPAYELKPNQFVKHIHRTFHLQGSEKQLNEIAQKTLGVSIDKIKKAF